MSGTRVDGDTGSVPRKGTEELRMQPIRNYNEFVNSGHQSRRIFGIKEADQLSNEINEGFQLNVYGLTEILFGIIQSIFVGFKDHHVL